MGTIPDMQAAIAAVGAEKKGFLLTVDGVHMNPAGNSMMAAGVLKGFGLSAEQIEAAKKSWNTATKQEDGDECR